MKNLALALLAFAPALDVECSTSGKKSARNATGVPLGQFLGPIQKSLTPKPKGSSGSNSGAAAADPVPAAISEDLVVVEPALQVIERIPAVSFASESLSLPTGNLGDARHLSTPDLAVAPAAVAEEILPLPEFQTNQGDYRADYAKVLTPVLQIVAQRVNSTVRTALNADMVSNEFSGKTQEQLRAAGHYALKKLAELEAGNTQAANLQQQALEKKIAALNTQDQNTQQNLLKEARDLEQKAQALKTIGDLALLRANLLSVMKRIYAEPVQKDLKLSQPDAMKHIKENADVKNLPKSIATAVKKNVNNLFADDVEEVPQSQVITVINENLPLGIINTGYKSEDVTFLDHLQHLSDNTQTANPYTVAAIMTHREKLTTVLSQLNSQVQRIDSSFETTARPYLPSLAGVTTLAQAIEILSGKNDQGTITSELMASLQTQRGALNAQVEDMIDTLTTKTAELEKLKKEKIHNTDMVLKLSRKIRQLDSQLTLLQSQLNELDSLITVRDRAITVLKERFTPKPPSITPKALTLASNWFSFGASSTGTESTPVAASEQKDFSIQQVFTSVVEEAACEVFSKQEKFHQLRLARYNEDNKAQTECYKAIPRIDLKKQVKVGYPATVGKDRFNVPVADISHIKSRPIQDALQGPTLEEIMTLFMDKQSPDFLAWKASHDIVLAKMQKADTDEHHDDDASPAAPAMGDALHVLTATTAEA